MTSRLVVNNIDNDTGVTTIRLNPTYSSFELNSAERVRIKSDGKVGIGTDNPSTDVHLYGNAPVLTVTPTNWQSGLRLNVVGLGYHGSNNQLFRVQKDGTTKLQLNEDGDLVITGDDNAELKLQCGTSSGNGIIAFLNSSGTTKGNIFYDSDHNFMVFKTNGTASSNERLRITSSGYIGINDTSGNARLIVKGDSDTSDADCQIRIYDTDSTSGSQIPSLSFWGPSTEIGRIRGTDTSGMRFYTHDGSSLGERVRITSLGNAQITKNVGIQTSSVEGTDLVGAGTSFFGAYIGDGMLAFHNRLDNSAGYYVAAHVNALNAGPVTLGSTMTLAGTWVIV